MARSPRARVSKTSGQGVSRYSYQKGHALGNSGTGSEFNASVKKPADKRNYGKLDVGSGFNVSYGNTIEPGDLDDIKEIARRKPKRR
jgi:hypothetical protein